MKLRPILLIPAFCLFATTCQTQKEFKVPLQLRKEIRSVMKVPAQTRELPRDDFLIQHIKKSVVLLKTGMTKPEVDSFLYLDRLFNGIVTSTGARTSFQYFYELRGYELILDFDYSQKKQGAFKRYELNPVI